MNLQAIHNIDTSFIGKRDDYVKHNPKFIKHKIWFEFGKQFYIKNPTQLIHNLFEETNGTYKNDPIKVKHDLDESNKNNFTELIDLIKKLNELLPPKHKTTNNYNDGSIYTKNLKNYLTLELPKEYPSGNTQTNGTEIHNKLKEIGNVYQKIKAENEKIKVTYQLIEDTIKEIQVQISNEEQKMLDDLIAWALERRAKDQETEIKKLEEKNEIKASHKKAMHSLFNLCVAGIRGLFSMYNANTRKGFGFFDLQMSDIRRIEKWPLAVAQSNSKEITGNANTEYMVYKFQISNTTTNNHININLILPTPSNWPREWWLINKYFSHWKKNKSQALEDYHFRSLQNILPHNDWTTIKEKILSITSSTLSILFINRLPKTYTWTINRSNYTMDFSAETPAEYKVYKLTYLRPNHINDRKSFPLILDSRENIAAHEWTANLNGELGKYDLADNSIINTIRTMDRNLFIGNPLIEVGVLHRFYCEILNIYSYTFTPSYYSEIKTVSHPDIENIRHHLLAKFNEAKLSIKNLAMLLAVGVPVFIENKLLTHFLDYDTRLREFDIKEKRFKENNKVNPEVVEGSNEKIRALNRAADLQGYPPVISEGALSYVEGGKSVNKKGEVSDLPGFAEPLIKIKTENPSYEAAVGSSIQIKAWLVSPFRDDDILKLKDVNDNSFQIIPKNITRTSEVNGTYDNGVYTTTIKGINTDDESGSYSDTFFIKFSSGNKELVSDLYRVKFTG